MNNGFTLIEIMVVMIVIGIISASLALAYPNARNAQKLTLVEQQLQAALREAQQKAINEERDNACTALFPDPDLQRHCSDIGVKLDANRGEFVLFADTAHADDNQWDSSDYPIKRLSWPAGVTVDTSASATTFIFEGVPPTVKLYAPGHEVTAPEVVVFKAGDAATTLEVYSYGQVERKN